MTRAISSTVAVVMAAYNAAATIDASIASVCHQTYPDWNLWVVDDGSTDGTWQRLLHWQQIEPRIRIRRLLVNAGPAVARNTALQDIDTEYIAFLDADDRWHPNKLEIQLRAMQSADLLLSYTCFEKLFPHQSRPPQQIVPPAGIVLADLERVNHILLSSAMLKRQPVADIRFPSVNHEDYVYWHRVLQRVQFAQRVGGTQLLAYYHCSPHSLSANKWRAALWHWCNLRHDMGLNLGYAVWCYLHYCCHHLWRELQASGCSKITRPAAPP